ncbi:MAG: hypothetical protein FWD61_03795 [Phycisphaerales bacterium]|nr:hypothetical protein [Phycisphaerales bacterium]
MTQAKQEDNWNHTAALLAMQANSNRDPKKGRSFKPADFHPIPTTRVKRTKSSPPPPLKSDITVLKIFVK